MIKLRRFSSAVKNGSEGNGGFAVYFHPLCEQHRVVGHPERPERVQHILSSLRNAQPDAEYIEAPECTDEDILLYHSRSHLDLLQSYFDRAEKKKTLQQIDGDTGVMIGTRDAIYRAAGSVIAAIDDILSQKYRSAFCCVRPPGHHATRSRSMGFCFVNNAAVAARYAQHKYGLKKIAVLDFDVHHGNGTEEGFAASDSLFYGSTHEKDNYPGTGEEPKFIGPESRVPIHRRIVNRYLDAGPQSKIQFRPKWTQIIEEMKLFSPNLIIFSAGFDAHHDDPLGGCKLNEEDFAWATQIVMDAAVDINRNYPIPCISVLEGGYNLRAIAKSAVAHCSVLKNWPKPLEYAALDENAGNILFKKLEEERVPQSDDFNDSIAVESAQKSVDIDVISESIFQLSVRIIIFSIALLDAL